MISINFRSALCLQTRCLPERAAACKLCKALPHFFEFKIAYIEKFAVPIDHSLSLWMSLLLHGFEEFLKTWNAANIFRRRTARAFDETWVFIFYVRTVDRFMVMVCRQLSPKSYT